MKMVSILVTLATGAVVLASDAVLQVGEQSRLAVTASSASDARIGRYNLGLVEAEPFYSTGRPISDERLIPVPDSTVLLALWKETSPSGDVVPYYAISLGRPTRGSDATAKFSRARATSYILRLRFSNFDPLRTTPPIPQVLRADEATNELYIVQFVTQPLEEFREAVRALGGVVYKFISEHAHIVRMTPEVRDSVARLPYVRWMGPLHPAYKLEELLVQEITSQPETKGSSDAGVGRYNLRKYSIMVFERGPGQEGAQQGVVADRIEALGGEVFTTIPEGFRLEAFLSLDQLRGIVAMNEIMFIDIRGELELDMDIGREISGANFVESMGGFTGDGVRAEVADTGLDVDHPDFQARPPIIHNNNNGGIRWHGTGVYGICFGDGTGDPKARGLLPDAQGIFANAADLRGERNIENRYRHTAELVDPDGPYRAVFQTNSTGDPRTREYTTLSAAMDDLLFAHDILHCQSVGPCNGTPDVRPQAWAKNIVSVSGVRHYDTLRRDDDVAAGCSGPAKDGRIKPTLVHLFDDVYTTTDSGGYRNAGGTSSATPLTCGHFGLFFQMWHEGVFPGFGGGESVFDSRSHMATAKAMLVNTAYRYPLSQGDFRRLRQGWGMVDLKTMFELRNKTYIIDETDVLENLDVGVHEVLVEPGEPVLRVTLVYTDPAGVPFSERHRINDLSLRVTSPSGEEYWGNNGLMESSFSTPGGHSNLIDTVENVFIRDPEPGTWVLVVIADEINEDSHVETPEVDADYALVASGVLVAEPEPGACCFKDGSCRDLMAEDCIAEGGRWYFRKDCSTFDCPRKGACCLDNHTCNRMFKWECDRIGGAEFMGEGVSCRRACLCDQIKKFKAKCSRGGTIKAVLKYRDARHDGETVTFRIDLGLRFRVEVRGKKARLFTCCYNGPKTVHLDKPEGCREPIEVQCP